MYFTMKDTLLPLPLLLPLPFTSNAHTTIGAVLAKEMDNLAVELNVTTIILAPTRSVIPSLELASTLMCLALPLPISVKPQLVPCLELLPEHVFNLQSTVSLPILLRATTTVVTLLLDATLELRTVLTLILALSILVILIPPMDVFTLQWTVTIAILALLMLALTDNALTKLLPVTLEMLALTTLVTLPLLSDVPTQASLALALPVTNAVTKDVIPLLDVTLLPSLVTTTMPVLPTLATLLLDVYTPTSLATTTTNVLLTLAIPLLDANMSLFLAMHKTSATLPLVETQLDVSKPQSTATTTMLALPTLAILTLDVQTPLSLVTTTTHVPLTLAILPLVVSILSSTLTTEMLAPTKTVLKLVDSREET